MRRPTTIPPGLYSGVCNEVGEGSVVKGRGQKGARSQWLCPCGNIIAGLRNLTNHLRQVQFSNVRHPSIHREHRRL